MAKLPKKVMGFDVSYLKKEYMEPVHSKMSASMKKHEESESAEHEKKEHKAASKLQQILKRGK